MKQLHLTEGAPAQRIHLPIEVASALCQLGAAVISPTGTGDWMISNIRKIGVIRVGDYQVDIHPKIPVSRLFFLMGYSINRQFWEEQDVLIDRDDDLLPAVTRAFIRQAVKATEQGLLQGYETFDESLHIFRGRMDVAAQISRRGGIPLPVQVLYDEFTTDIPENRLLLSAAHRLLRLPLLPRSNRTELWKLTHRLDGVRLLLPGAALPSVHFTRLNARYSPAVMLAQLILQNTSLEQRPGEILAMAFLFDMWQIFEDFITAALGDALKQIGGSVVAQSKGTSLDAAGTIALRPDLLWKDASTVKAVIDAKYKAAKNSFYPNADIYQMLAYCVRFELRTGHLVYAKGEEDPQVHHIIGHGTNIHCHAVDLAQPPDRLLLQLKRIAISIYETSRDSIPQ